MSDVSLKINNAKGANAELSVTNAESQHVTAIISGVFGVLIDRPSRELHGCGTGKPVCSGSETAAKVETKALEAPKAPPIQVQKVETNIQVPNTTEVKQNPVISRPKQLPVINGERTLMQNLGEKMREIGIVNSDRPMPFETNGKMVYPTRYVCECGDAGIRFNAEENEYTKCRACNTKLRLRFATPGGIEQPDENGMYFVADAPYE
ncbi:hypothetical protein [Brevibacillus migulae]|uniref:hypothetical protein n=1 Tax=Brevibacillus migulae TaxID=1644114 RepID=UPI00106E8178|nr:hypothetical protein [Brevibacillus migulae]